LVQLLEKHDLEFGRYHLNKEEGLESFVSAFSGEKAFP